MNDANDVHLWVRGTVPTSRGTLYRVIIAGQSGEDGFGPYTEVAVYLNTRCLHALVRSLRALHPRWYSWPYRNPVPSLLFSGALTVMTGIGAHLGWFPLFH